MMTVSPKKDILVLRLFRMYIGII